MSAFARTDRSPVGLWWWTMDRWTAVAVTCLIAIGAILSLAASPAIAAKIDQPTFYFVYKNLLFLIPSFFLMFAVSMLSPYHIRRFALWLFVGALALMVLTLFIGTEVNGAKRWIKVAGFSLQASEFIKPAFVVLAAWLFAEHNRRADYPGIAFSCILFAIVAGLLVMQPDFGQTMLLGMVWGTMFFLSGVPLPWIAALGAGAVAGGFAAYSYMPHVASRIDRFIDPSSGDTYQVDQALAAFEAGGLTGLGPGEGTIKDYIPDAHTDFIFAVAGEEGGMLACLVLIMIFGFIIVRSLLRVLNKEDHFLQLAGAGLICLFGYQALINMGVSLSLLPAKGMTLPFISYGGSSLLATAITVGMMLALTRNRAVSALYTEVVPK